MKFYCSKLKIIVSVFCLFLFCVTAQAQENTVKAKLIFQKGKLTGVEKQPLTFLREFPSDTVVFTGDQELKKTELKGNISLLQESVSVIAYSNNEIVTLTNGSSSTFKLYENGSKVYQLKGAVHLLVKQNGVKEKQELIINGLKLETTGGHFYYNSWDENPTLTLISGNSSLVTKGQKFRTSLPDSSSETKGGKTDATSDLKTAETLKETDATADQINKAKVEKISETINLLPLQRIIYDDGFILAKQKLDPAKKEYQVSLIEGFKTPGIYEVVGSVKSADKVLKIKRFKMENFVQADLIPLFKGDQIQTATEQTITLNFNTGDKIKVSPNSTLTVEEFLLEEKEENILFGFLGKIKALIAKREALGKIRFKSPTATIGIKGTYFEAIASEDVAEVSTIEGLVGVSDADGAGEVDVAPGMKTRVEAGKKPEEPTSVREEKLKELLRTGIAAREIIIHSPANGSVLKEADLNFEVIPRNAELNFFIDNEEHSFTTGSKINKFSELKEGKHTLVIKGIGENPLESKVEFIIDRTAPALTKETNFEYILLEKGQSANFKINEAIANAKLTYFDQEISPELSADKKQLTVPLEALNLRKLPGEFKLTLIDQAGNKSEINGVIAKKPEAPLVISFNQGIRKIETNSVSDIKIRANRQISKWNLKLDQKILELPKVKQGQEIIISASEFASLSEGKHQLTVNIEDLFKIKQEAILNIKLDKTAPKLILPEDLKPGNIRLLEGKSIALNWSEELAKFEISYLNKQKLLALKETKTGADLAQGIFNFREKLTPVKLIAQDKAGNKTEIKTNLIFVKKIVTVPKIKIGSGSLNLITKKLDNLMVVTDRPIKSWKITLDTKDLTKAVFKNDREQLLSEILLPKDLFAKLKDGKHQLKVKVEDEFKQQNEQELKIILDNQAPVLTYATPGRLKDLILNEQETLLLPWNESLAKVEATVGDNAWPVMLENTKQGIILTGNADLLKISARRFNIKVYDLSGNSTVLKGYVALKIVDDNKVLGNRYKNSIILATGLSSDKLYKIDRGEFIYYHSNIKNEIDKFPKNIPRTTNNKKRLERKIHNILSNDFYLE